MVFTPIGSIGDIVAVGNLIRDLITALDNDKGSHAEYQDCIRKLAALERTLQEVETLYTIHNDTAELNTLCGTMHHIVNQCRQTIEAFSKRVEKFGPSLSENGSGNRARDAYKKTQWRVSRSDDLAKIGTGVGVYCSNLSVLVSSANVYVPSEMGRSVITTSPLLIATKAPG